VEIDQLQVDFLTELSRLEERVDDKRKIDVDDNHLDDVITKSTSIYNEIMRIREWNIRYCLEGKDKKPPEFFQEAVRERCKSDIIYWFNHWAWTFIPSLTKYNFPAMVPFVLFPRQQEYVLWREDLYKRNKSGTIYKCREVGVSWLNCGVQTYHWLFEDGFQGRFGSRKENLVDSSNNPDSLFWKIRFLIWNLPQWMKHEDWWKKTNKHDQKLTIFNPGTGATIAGEGGDNMGTGGRAAMYDVDEWAKVEHDKMVEASISLNCPCRFYTSTPMGAANDFAEKVQKGLLPIFEFDYSDDPRKSKDWFENFKEMNSEQVVAQEVLKKFDAFSAGTCIPAEWVLAAVKLKEKIEKGEIEYESEDVVCALDVAAGGSNRSVHGHRRGIVVEGTTEWNLDNTTILTRHAASETERVGGHTLNYDPISVGVGVKSTFQLEDFAFRPVPVDVRRAASEIPLEGDTRPARERCQNRRAELAVRLRIRFERTYEFMSNGVDHPIEALIAIPNETKLRNQLSLPELYQQNGKYRLEPKDAMVRRGIESPDYFDMSMLLFADEVEEQRVVKSFDYQKSVIEEYNYRIEAMENTHLVSVYHSKNLTAAAISAVWNGAKLVACEEHYQQNGTVSEMVNAIRSKFIQSKNTVYIGNKEIFKKGEDDLFMQYLESNIMLQENTLFNELSAVSMLNQMCETGQFRILKKLRLLINQIDGFSRERGVPDTKGMEVALAACNMINHLSEVQKIEVKTVVRRGYERTASSRNEVFSRMPV